MQWRPTLPNNQPPENINQGDTFDKYLSWPIQALIEGRYYARIVAQSRLEHLLNDATFIKHPQEHSSLFSDHSIVHVRDVARNILQVLDNANGVLFPPRDTGRLEFMKGYAIQLAFIHDICLYDLSFFGRKTHAFAVTQKIFSPELDDLFQAIWDENAGNVPGQLSKIPFLKGDPRIIYRELLALAVCHSKSAVPVRLLGSPHELQKAMLFWVTCDLHDLFDRLTKGHSTNSSPAINTPLAGSPIPVGLAAPASPERVDILKRYYNDFLNQGFAWLIDEQPLVQQFVQDVIDTLRALRCADALRQRGTTLKTSGNYEIFVDRKTGNAVFALRETGRDLILLEFPDPISAGEANLASCEFTQEGDLRASFHRGSFPDAETIKKAVINAVLVLTDIYKDVIESFQRFPPPPQDQKEYPKEAGQMQILLENVSDNPEFASLVQRHFQQCNPTVHNPIRVVPSLKDVSERERRFYMEARELEWDDQARQEALNWIAKFGHKTDTIDPHLAFQDVKLISIQAGTTLIEAGAQPGFVYIPISGSLQVIPLGGYPPILNQPWMPVGITAVIRGSVRNATVVAEEEVTLLMIPQEIYLNHWHKTYNLDEFIQWMGAERGKQN